MDQVEFKKLMPGICQLQAPFYHIDIFDMVWFGHYTKYFYEGNLAWWQEFSKAHDISTDGVKFGDLAYIVHSININYFNAAKLGQNLSIHTYLKSIGRAKFCMFQRILHMNDLVAEAETQFLCLNVVSKKITLFPTWLIDMTSPYMCTELS